MRHLLRPLIAIASFVVASSAMAHVTVSNPWTRATVAQQTATGVFMDLRSGHDNAKLVGIKTEAAASAELHEMKMQDNVMKMRAVTSLDLPNGQTVSLKPGSYHIMLMGLKKPLSAGETVELTLDVVHEDGKTESIAVSAPARALGNNAPAAANDAKAGHDHRAHKH